ncbi:hypothetical protein KEM48_013342 [Puccinia striiformis f. sp. tritici PST-130]|nr:hypothetical protein KEM48_013342 [Puccinia striiformis f. sp. tritici PST-130]
MVKGMIRSGSVSFTSRFIEERIVPSLRGESSRSIKTSTTTLGQSEDNNNLDLIKANQQIIGLKLIARKSNEDRNKLEKVNLELVNEIEELKLKKINKLIKFGQFKLNSSSSLSPSSSSSAINNKEESDPRRRISIGIENEITLSPQMIPLYNNSRKRMGTEVGNCIGHLNDKLSNLNSKHSREVEGLNKETPTATPTTGTMTVRDRSPSTSVGGGADLQRRSSVVWRRRTSETGPHPPSTPVTTTTSFNNSLSPIGLSASPSPIKTFAHNLRFSTGLNGLAESEEDSVQGIVADWSIADSPLTNFARRRRTGRRPLHPARNPKRMTRMIVTDHDSGAPHSELD